MDDPLKNETEALSRRGFLKASAAMTAGVLGSQLPLHHFVHAAGTDTLRIGAIGVGGRGGGAVRNCLDSAEGLVVWAIGDYWTGKGQDAANRLKADRRFTDRVQVTPERCFSGFDNYKQVIDSGVDLIVDAAPPGFRPLHFRYAVEKGKHVFMEKPVATCPAGVRMVIEAAKAAKAKGLGVVAGTQRRHTPAIVETVKRIQGGALGQIVAAQGYYCSGRPWNREKQTPAGATEIERQIFNWYHYCWLSGDQIVEQHIHDLDVLNWVFGNDETGEIAHPVRCMGMGGLAFHRGEDGRSTEPGNIWDSMAVEFEYPNGALVQSYCRHWDGCRAKRGGVNVIGTRGRSSCSGHIEGENAWAYQGGDGDRSAQVQEHTDLIASIRAGKPLNEGESIAVSSGVAILGRMAAYTGQDVTWEFMLNESKLNHLIEDPKPGDHPVEPLPVPGKTKLI